MRGNPTVVISPAAQDLNAHQEIEYALYHRGFIDWMRERGKNPKKREGLSESCVENYARRQHQIWSQIDRLVANPSHDQVDMFVETIAADMILRHDGQEYASTSKRKFNGVLRKWFEYRHDKHGAEQWEPPVEFSDNDPVNAADYSSLVKSEIAVQRRDQLAESSFLFA